MLREIKNVKQERGGGRRRWFESEGLELVVWLVGDARVAGFQVCYDFGRGERALTWREEEGFAHSFVDAGDETPFKNETPVLRPDPHVPWVEIARAFDLCSEGLEPDLRCLVQEQLKTGAGKRKR